MEYMVEHQPPHFHDRPEEADWALQHRTLELDVASGSRMAQSEENEEEQSADLSGSQAEPSLASTWNVLSEDIHGLTGSGLSDPYQTHKPTEMFDYFVPMPYQFNKAINAGDVGTKCIIPDVFQATKLTGRNNEVAVPSSGFSVQELRVLHPLQEHVMAHQEENMDFHLSGQNGLNSHVPNSEDECFVYSGMPTTCWGGNLDSDCSKFGQSQYVFIQTGDTCEDIIQDTPLIGKNEVGSLSPSHDTIAQNENTINLTRANEQRPSQSLGENASSDGSGNQSFLLMDDLSNARSPAKINESGFNSVAVTLPESIPE